MRFFIIKFLIVEALVGLAFFFLSGWLAGCIAKAIGNAAQSVIRLLNKFLYVRFVFGPAVVGGLMIGLGLYFATHRGGDPAADTINAATIGALDALVILAVRAWQWRGRRRREIISRQDLAETGDRLDVKAFRA